MSNVEIFPPRDAVDDEVFDSNQLWVAPVENDEPLPDKFLTPPFKNLRATKAWLDGSAAKTHPVISLIGAFHIAQTASARRYRSSNDNQLFLLLCVIARTGAGKDYIRKAHAQVYKDSRPEVLHSGGFASAPGLFAALEGASGILAPFIDEFGDFLKEAVSKKGSCKAGVVTLIRIVFSAGCTMIKPESTTASGKTKEQVDHSKNRKIDTPCLPLLGLTTKNQLLDVVSDDLLNDGSINRFIFAPCEGIEPVFIKFADVKAGVPAWLSEVVASIGGDPAEDLVKKANGSGINMDGSIPQYIIPFSDAANVLVDRIGDVDQPGTLLQELATDIPHIINMATRFRENSMRLASIITVFEGDKAVSGETLQWSYDFVVYLGTRFSEAFKLHREEKASSGKAPTYGELRQGILDVVRKEGIEGITAMDIGRCPPGRYVNAKARREAFADLLDTQQITSIKKQAKGRRPETRYYALAES